MIMHLKIFQQYSFTKVKLSTRLKIACSEGEGDLNADTNIIAGLLGVQDAIILCLLTTYFPLYGKTTLLSLQLP